MSSCCLNLPAALPRIRDRWTECVVSCYSSSFEWIVSFLRVFFSRRYSSVLLPLFRRGFDTYIGNRSWSHQNLQFAPALPILDISVDHIFAVLEGFSLGSSNSYSNSTSRMHHRESEPFNRRELGHADTTPAMLNPLVKRDGAEPCSAGKPCADDR